jgi:hypothetical protein
MSHDFGSIGSQNRRSGSKSGAASGGVSSPGIGFHELRQALEISTLREDLERLSQGADALREHVEDAVEQVRDRFAALSAEEMADAAAMAPLLQFAVAALLDVREQVRRLDTRTGPVGDEDRPSWQGPTDSPRSRPSHHAAPVVSSRSEVEDAPPPPHPDPTPVSPVMMTPPAPSAPSPRLRDVPSSDPILRGEARQAAPPSMSASWLTSESPLPPPPSRTAATRGGGGGAAPLPGAIDWLGRAGR